MSDIRDTARSLLDANLPAGKIITSNGPTGPKYTEMTGLTHKRLTDNWAGGGIMTGCNGFTGWYGARMGSKSYLGGFDLKGIVAKAGKPTAWVKSTRDNRPKYGDILRHASFHVDVALDFDGDILTRAAGGQGGPKSGCDIIKRVPGKTPYDSSKLEGWIDIELYFGDGATQVSLQVPEWLTGWWEIRDSTETYFYYFFRSGVVQYTRMRPTTLYCPNFADDATGRFAMALSNKFTITWNVADYPRETFEPTDNERPPALKGSLADYSGIPFSAAKLG